MPYYKGKISNTNTIEYVTENGNNIQVTDTNAMMQELNTTDASLIALGYGELTTTSIIDEVSTLPVKITTIDTNGNTRSWPTDYQINTQGVTMWDKDTKTFNVDKAWRESWSYTENAQMKSFNTEIKSIIIDASTATTINFGINTFASMTNLEDISYVNFDSIATMDISNALFSGSTKFKNFIVPIIPVSTNTTVTVNKAILQGSSVENLITPFKFWQNGDSGWSSAINDNTTMYYQTPNLPVENNNPNHLFSLYGGSGKDLITATDPLVTKTSYEIDSILRGVHGNFTNITSYGYKQSITPYKCIYTTTTNATPETITIDNSSATFGNIFGIGSNAKIQIADLSSIVLDGFTSIGYGAFYPCINLASVDICSTVVSIGDTAFVQCTSLKTISIPSSVKTIGFWSFYRSGLENINLVSGLEKISKQAFLRSGNLKSVVIPTSVTDVRDGAFQKCESLTTVVISSTTNQEANVIKDISSNANLYYYDMSSEPHRYYEGQQKDSIGGNLNTIISTGVDRYASNITSSSNITDADLTNAGYTITTEPVSSQPGKDEEAVATEPYQYLPPSNITRSGHNVSIGLTLEKYHILASPYSLPEGEEITIMDGESLPNGMSLTIDGENKVVISGTPTDSANSDKIVNFIYKSVKNDDNVDGITTFSTITNH